MDLGAVHARGALGECARDLGRQGREALADHALAPRHHGFRHLVLAEHAHRAVFEPLPQLFRVGARGRVRAVVAVGDHDVATRLQDAGALVEEVIDIVVMRDRLDAHDDVRAARTQWQVRHVGAHRQHAPLELGEVRAIDEHVRTHHGLVHLDRPHALGAPGGQQIGDHPETGAAVDDDLALHATHEVHELLLRPHPGPQPAIVEHMLAEVAVEPRIDAVGSGVERGTGGGDE